MSTNILNSVIRDGATLKASIAAWRVHGAEHRKMGHVLLVSCLIHVAEHGQVGILNNLYEAASTNERTSIKNYVRRFQTEMELVDGKFVPVRDEEGSEVPSKVAFLDFARNEFSVRGGHMEQRKAFVTFAEEHLVTPSKRWPAFTDINILAERARFDTSSLASRLKALVKTAEKNKANLSPKAFKRLDEAATFITSIAEGIEEETAEGAQVDANASRNWVDDFSAAFRAKEMPKVEAKEPAEPPVEAAKVPAKTKAKPEAHA